jgi:hypothetical protein
MLRIDSIDDFREAFAQIDVRMSAPGPTAVFTARRADVRFDAVELLDHATIASPRRTRRLEK